MTNQPNKQTTLLITQTDYLQTNWKPLMHKRKQNNNGFKYISEYSLLPLRTVLWVSNLVPAKSDEDRPFENGLLRRISWTFERGNERMMDKTA
jgi:hypothetical protein